MDIRGQRRSSNIEDRRGMSPVRKGVGLSLGGILFLIVLSFFGINPLPFLGVATKQAPVEMQQSSQPYQESAAEAQLSELAGVTLAQTEETWGKLFGGKYPPPTMVMFSGQTPSACGTGQAAMGPFYCPLDQKVYLDLSFFQELEQKFGAPGDFAQAYVIAHEVGHHVQNVTGTAQQVQQAAAAREQQGRGEPVLRDAGTAGGLLRRRVGARRGAATQHHPGGHRRRPARGDCHRRRHAAARNAGPRRARCVHARHVGAAQPLADDGDEFGRSERLRYVQRKPALSFVAFPVLGKADSRWLQASDPACPVALGKADTRAPGHAGSDA